MATVRDLSGNSPVVTDADLSFSPNLVRSLDSIVVIPGQITRPNNTSIYDANDLLGASTSVNPSNVIEFANAVTEVGQALRIERIRLAKSTNVTTNAQLRLHIFAVRPTLGVGDNEALGVITALNVDSMRYHAGFVDITLNRAGNDVADGASGVAVPVIGTGLSVRPVNGTSVFGVLQWLAAYTPGASEIFWPNLEGIRG